MRQFQKRIKAKIIRHSPIFGRGYLETHCECGCVYRTSMKSVEPAPRFTGMFGESEMAYTTKCPECKIINWTKREEVIERDNKG